MKNNSALESEDTQDIKQKVQSILAQAEITKSSNINEALTLLRSAADNLRYMKKDVDKMSVRNATQNQEELKIIYLSKRGNILYEIEEYAEALESYNLIREKIPGNFKVYKALGDCCRKLGKYEEALAQYEIALDKCGRDRGAGKEDKAAILNSKGLLQLKYSGDVLDKDNIQKALEIFEQAVKLNGKSPLYYCNLGRAEHLLGHKEEAIKSFKKAGELVANNELGEELNGDNRIYIEKTLVEFTKRLEDLGKVSLTRPDKIIAQREDGLIEKGIESLSKEVKDLNEEFNQCIGTKEALQKIESDQRLYEYYDGFIFNVNRAYSTAMTVSSDAFAIDTSNLAVDGAAFLVSLIPLVGEKASSGITKIKDFIIEAKVKQKANNICKFASGVTEFEALAQDAIVASIISKEKDIVIIDPEQYILRSWSDKFKNIVAKTQDKIETKLYGNRNETPMQKLGYKNSCDLVAKIASGEIYEGKLAITMRSPEKTLKLQQSALTIIDSEIANWNKQYEPAAVEVKTSCCKCEIFYFNEIKYDNELLNHPKLLSEATSRYSMSEILDLSVGLDNGLIYEAIQQGNEELVLAGLISLDI